MIGLTDFLHPSPAPHFKTFQVFLIYDTKRPKYKNKKKKTKKKKKKKKKKNRLCTERNHGSKSWFYFFYNDDGTDAGAGVIKIEYRRALVSKATYLLAGQSQFLVPN
jgi:hypothetical protein